METTLFLLNKLVRDKVIAQCETIGAVYTDWSSLEKNDEYRVALGEKIIEELQEVFQADSRENLIEELADVEEVWLSLKKLMQVSQKEIEEARTNKKQKKGGFENRAYVRYVKCEVDSQLYKKLIQDPKKHPVITEQDL